MRFFSTDQDCCARTSPSGDRPTSGLSPPTLPLLRAAGRSAFDCTRPTRAGFVPVLVSINRGAVGRFLLRQSSEHILIVRAPGAGESPTAPLLLLRLRDARAQRVSQGALLLRYLYPVASAGLPAS